MDQPRSVFHEEKTAIEYQDVALETINANQQQQHHLQISYALTTPSPSLVSIAADENGNMRRSLLLKNAMSVDTPYEDPALTVHNNGAPRRGKQRAYYIINKCLVRSTGYIRSKMAFKPAVTDDPRLQSAARKRLILAALALGASLNGFCSTVYFPGIPNIALELNASEIEITLVSSLFILFGGIGPIFWASVSDYYYIRRFLYLIALLIFVVASIGCALASSAYMLIVLRCIQSIGTSGQFLGPLIGPIIGGGITTAAGWRSVFWLCTGYGIFLFVFFFVFFPETYRVDHRWDQQFTELPSQTTLAMDEASRRGSSAVSVSMPAPASLPVVADAASHPGFNPFKSLAMMQYIFVCFIAIEIGFCFGTMFTLETLIPDIYFTHYGFDSWQTGIGNVLGSVVSGRLSDYLLIRSSNKRGGISKAEDRLTLNAWPGGFVLIPLGVLLFGWSIMAGFSVWPAIIGFSILCFGMSQVYTAGSAYLVDSIPGKGASVTAACNFFRMTMAAVLSFVSPIIGSALSIGYVCVLLASLNVIGMSLLVYIKFKGIHLRRKAGFAQAK
ncbi:hypothetical protein [Parasitella parasitica]|uniref:Major facilitator superfamily (MFS) profile domain-containing protein n=1 Tax=Parasitella parasitica TaxID=35722 RepID=A0A0B7NL65_9FUNG|nr:hypothetical protein [Parasitella parasitica]